MQTRTQDGEKKTRLQDALISTQHSVGRVHEILKLDTGIDLDAFAKVFESKLIPQLDPNYPLMVAITGGGSSGKSSLFNALVGKNLSAVKAKAGLSRRVLAAIHPDVLARDGFLASLFEAFGADPEPLSEIAELTTPGTPKYVACDNVHPSLILLDTPDFDTGDCETFANRGVVKPVLEACDVLLYIFTNATYNNQANTVFMRDALTAVGNRRVILVYRCTRVLTEDEVREHADNVARNLYGPDFKTWLTGVYRVNEDDAVAGGHALMRVDPLSGEKPILEVLASLDCAQTRADFRRSALREVACDAQKTVAAATVARMELELYRDAVRVATSWAAANALKSFPQAVLMQRFLEVWEQSQPRGLKMVKSVGRVVAAPVKGLAWVMGTFRDNTKKDQPPFSKAVSPEEMFETNLSEAANDLRNTLLGQAFAVETTEPDPIGNNMFRLVKEIQSHRASSVDGLPVVESLKNDRLNIRVARPVSIASAKETRRQGRLGEQLHEILEEVIDAPDVSENFELQLQEIARDFRSKMGWGAKLREGFTASLAVLPAVGAATYVLLTVDPVVGTGIYAKLVSLFGLNDLWALVAIPVTTGLNKADRDNLEKMLSPIFALWFKEKVERVRGILEKHICGDRIAIVEKLLKESEKPLTELTEAAATFSEGENK